MCRRWFTPDVRVGERQRTCSSLCRGQLRKRQQAVWREAHPDYFAARRMAARAARAEEEKRAPSPLRMRPPLNRLPWDIAQSEFGVQGADFLGVLSGVLVQVRQSERRGQALDSS